MTDDMESTHLQKRHHAIMENFSSCNKRKVYLETCIYQTIRNFV